jgi:hypothetical protein
MSERVTWEVCPRCGCAAAVGWARLPGAGGAPDGCVPVEFDCLAGCEVGLDVLAQAYRLLRRLPAEGASEPGQQP